MRPVPAGAPPPAPGRNEKILILTAGYGEGHNSAARALGDAFQEQPGVDSKLIDLFALRAPRVNTILRHAYLKLINNAPALWAKTYRWLDRSPRAPWMFEALASHRRLLGRILDQEQPVAVCSTYPVYGWLLDALRRGGRVRCPVFTIVTDALTINSLWYRASADGWFVTDHDSAALLHERGISAAKIKASGFPVALTFADRPLHWQPGALDAGCPMPGRSREAEGGRPRILFMINSGRGHALGIARALLRQRGWRITITAGHDKGLRHELQALAQGAPARAEVLGWTRRIPELLMTHHVVISKAGGATTQESINALCPMLISQIVPGQEEGNYELLRRHGAGALAESPEAIVETLCRAFADDAALWNQWRIRLRALARPAAARDIAATVLARARQPPTSEPATTSRGSAAR